MKRHKKNTPPDTFVEVLDNENKPLLIMPQHQAVRHNLRHRGVAVCLRNLTGHIFLHQRPVSEAHGGQWNLAASGRVLAGESCYAAAERRLEEELGITGLQLFETTAIPASPATGNVAVALFATMKTSAIPKAQEGIFVDREELRAILRNFPHMVTPLLHAAVPHLYFSGM